MVMYKTMSSYPNVCFKYFTVYVTEYTSVNMKLSLNH